MTDVSTKRRAFGAAAVAIVIAAAMLITTAHSAQARPVDSSTDQIQTAGATAPSSATGTASATARKICLIDWRKGTWHVKQLIRCAVRYYKIPGGITTALSIAHRESKYRPRAYNSSSCAKGIYQHLCRYWSGRASSYGFKGWSAFNARANIIVTMRMVKRYGWAPWS